MASHERGTGRHRSHRTRRLPSGHDIPRVRHAPDYRRAGSASDIESDRSADPSANAPVSPAPPPLPALSVLPATLVVPTAPGAPVKAKAWGSVLSRRQPLHMPRGEDLAYVGVTVASALAIAVAATLQLSDSWSASHTDELRTAAAPAATAPPALADRRSRMSRCCNWSRKAPTTSRYRVECDDAASHRDAERRAARRRQRRHCSVHHPAVTASLPLRGEDQLRGRSRTPRAARVAAQSGGDARATSDLRAPRHAKPRGSRTPRSRW